MGVTAVVQRGAKRGTRGRQKLVSITAVRWHRGMNRPETENKTKKAVNSEHYNLLYARQWRLVPNTMLVRNIHVRPQCRACC